MKSYKSLLSLFLPIILLIFVPSASARFPTASGSMTAVLHMDPDDDPIAGQPATFFVDLHDTKNAYTPTQCVCNLIIREEGKVIYTQSLFKMTPNPGLNTPVAVYTLPQRDVYQVEIDGTPKTLHAFQPFSLVWNVRVDRQAITTPAQSMAMNNTMQTSSTSSMTTEKKPLLLGLIGVIFVIAIGIVCYFSFRKQKQPLPPQPIQPPTIVNTIEVAQPVQQPLPQSPLPPEQTS